MFDGPEFQFCEHYKYEWWEWLCNNIGVLNGTEPYP